MSAREADEVLVSDAARHPGRVDITVVHGRYETALNLSVGEMARLRAAIDAHLSTPPADDVREALAREVEPTAWTEVHPHPTIYADDPEARAQYEAYFHEGQRDRRAPSLAIADRLLSSLTFEVRPHGTVAEAEGAWEYGVRHVAVDGWPTDLAHGSLEAARTDIATCGWNCYVIRRRAAQDAGQWEPVEAAREVHP